MRLAFESQTAFPNVVSIKFLEGLNTSKHGERRIHLFFPSHWLSLVISSHLITSHHITSHHIISSLFMFISDPETRIYCTGSSGSQVFVFELNYIGKIWENGIVTFILSCMKQVTSPGSMHDTGCLGLVHWDDPEGGYGEGGGFRMGNTGIPVADSFRYLAKPIQYCKV